MIRFGARLPPCLGIRTGCMAKMRAVLFRFQAPELAFPMPFQWIGRPKEGPKPKHHQLRLGGYGMLSNKCHERPERNAKPGCLNAQKGRFGVSKVGVSTSKRSWVLGGIFVVWNKHTNIYQPPVWSAACFGGPGDTWTRSATQRLHYSQFRKVGVAWSCSLPQTRLTCLRTSNRIGRSTLASQFPQSLDKEACTGTRGCLGSHVVAPKMPHSPQCEPPARVFLERGGKVQRQPPEFGELEMVDPNKSICLLPTM